MATRSPASVRRSGCCAVKAAVGHSSRATIQGAFMRGLLRRESVDGATGAGRGVFHGRAARWMGEPLKGCGHRVAPGARVRGGGGGGCQGPRAGGAARWPQLPGLPERANFPAMHEWQVWLVASLLLFVAEMLAPGFWLLSVAVGCLTAGVVSLVVPGAIVPALSFAAGTLLSLVGIRPFLLRYLHPRGTEIRTNMDALAGRVGIVSERIDRPPGT